MKECLDPKYKKWYTLLIDKAILREKLIDEYYEEHHIIPKCIGGNDTSDNLVYLTYREHLIVHILLCKIYPHSKKLAFAANIMLYGNKTSKRLKLRGVSTRTKSMIKRNAVNARKGMKMPEWFGPYIAQKNKERIVSDETKNKISKANKGKKKTAEHREKMEKILWKKGNIPWNKGKQASDKTRQNMSNAAKERNKNPEYRKKLSEVAKKRGFRGKTKKVINTINNVVYISTESCARDLGVCSATIRYWIKNHPEKGFKFLDD